MGWKGVGKLWPLISVTAVKSQLTSVVSHTRQHAKLPVQLDVHGEWDGTEPRGDAA